MDMESDIEVTVPLKLEASITFYVPRGTELTQALIDRHINVAQRITDRRGNDTETGIYFIIKGQDGEPSTYDPELDD